MPDSWSSVWGHLVHFTKLSLLSFSKGTASTIFIYMYINCNQTLQKACNRGKYGLVLIVLAST